MTKVKSSEIKIQKNRILLVPLNAVFGLRCSYPKFLSYGVVDSEMQGKGGGGSGIFSREVHHSNFRLLVSAQSSLLSGL